MLEERGFRGSVVVTLRASGATASAAADALDAAIKLYCEKTPWPILGVKHVCWDGTIRRYCAHLHGRIFAVDGDVDQEDAEMSADSAKAWTEIAHDPSFAHASDIRPAWGEALKNAGGYERYAVEGALEGHDDPDVMREIIGARIGRTLSVRRVTPRRVRSPRSVTNRGRLSPPTIKMPYPRIKDGQPIEDRDPRSICSGSCSSDRPVPCTAGRSAGPAGGRTADSPADLSASALRDLGIDRSTAQDALEDRTDPIDRIESTGRTALEDRTHERRAERVRKRVLTVVLKVGSIAQSAIKKGLTSRDRSLLPEALRELEARGLIEREQSARGTRWTAIEESDRGTPDAS